jgi:hypothetical protein
MAEHEMNPRTIYPPSNPEYSLAGDALRQEQIRNGGVGTDPDPAAGMRYATEPPEGSNAATRRRAQRTAMWSAAGALAGAAAAMIGLRLAGRR